MLSVAMVGNSREEWCRYVKHVPLNDESQAWRCVVASPRLAVDPLGASAGPYRDLVKLCTSSAVALHTRAGSRGLVQEVLKLFSGVDGVALGSCAAGFFTSQGGALVSSVAVEVHALFATSQKVVAGNERLSDTGTLRLFDWSADQLHVAVIPRRNESVPPEVLRRLYKPGVSREQVIQRLGAWIRKRTSAPTLILVYGQTDGQDDSLFPGELQNSLTITSEDKSAIQDQTETNGECDAKLIQHSSIANELLVGIEEARSIVKAWPAAALYRGLLDRLQDAQAEHIESSVLLPLCRHIIHLHDTLQEALQERPNNRELLEALNTQVLSILEKHDITPFTESSAEFNPKTQEAVGRPSPGMALRSLRCGFRKGSSIVRREKVVFSPVTRSWMENNP